MDGGSDASALTGWAGILTVPNLISIARLGCIPWFMWLLFGAEDRMWAALLLGGLGATDWVDGWAARRLGQVSELGKILDPTADRLLLLVAVPCLLIDGTIPGGFALTVLVREVLVGGPLWFSPRSEPGESTCLGGVRLERSPCSGPFHASWPGSRGCPSTRRSQ